LGSFEVTGLGVKQLLY